MLNSPFFQGLAVAAVREHSRAGTPNRSTDKQVNPAICSSAQQANPRRDSCSSKSSTSSMPHNGEKSWRENESHGNEIGAILKMDEPPLKLSYADRTRPARYPLILIDFGSRLFSIQ